MTLTAYHNFIGVDIGKFELVVHVHGSSITQSFTNDVSGFKAFNKAFKKELKKALVILETTGGYELALLLFLHKIKTAVHRANTRHVKNFIRSLGTLAKTDRLDAMALARYGYERHTHLSLFKAHKEALTLYELAQRRRDLKKMLVQEKNRMQAPRCNELVKESCTRIIALLTKQVKKIDQHLQIIIDKDPELKARQAVLENIEGIGPVIARDLICFMPELGTLNQKQIASLAGVAPHANESGLFKGQRRIKGGRREVRACLFMAAMATRNSNSRLRTFYEGLIARGKKPLLALTALMRKIIVIANARIKELLEQSLVLRHS